MKYRKFGKTDLMVSEVGFGAWGIGGPAMAGNIPIGWGEVNDDESIKAINKSFDLGVNFFDTADFYGLGHSEEILAKVFSERWNDVILATKVGHRLAEDSSIFLDYSKNYIIEACEKSLQRLRKETIDLYQLHSARMQHLEQGECIEAMERLLEQGKIRYWGISLNTFAPDAEAEFFVKNNIGHAFQLVFNIINQRALKNVIPLAEKNNYGVIARMPLQFGLLTGKFTRETTFGANDHRSFRLTPELMRISLDSLEYIWEIAEKYKVPKTTFAISYVMNYPGVSTAIAGIKSESQAEENLRDIIQISNEDIMLIENYFDTTLSKVVEEYKNAG